MVFREVSAAEVLGMLGGGGRLNAVLPLLGGLALATVVAAGAALLNAGKWWLLLRACGVDLRWKRVAYHYLVGFFLNTIFTGLGEVKRVVDVGRESNHTAAVASSVFLERWTGVMGQLGLALVTLVVACRWYPGLTWLLGLDLLACFGLLGLFGALVVASSRPALSASTAETGGWNGALGAFRRARRAPAVMAVASTLSFIVPLLGVLSHAFLGVAVGLGLGFLWVVPIATVFGQLPVSFNGVGVQEVAYTALFERTGASLPQAMAVSLLAHGVKILVGGLGGLLSLGVGRRSPSAVFSEGNSPLQEGASPRA